MLDGLEAVELTLSESKYDNNTFRFDSEYFKKEYLLIDNIIEKNKIIKLNLLSDWITQGSNPKFSENGIHCLTGRNINSGIVKYENSDFVNLDEYNSLKRFQLKINDILITLKGKGSIGKIGFVTDTRKSIFSRDVGLIRVNNKISPTLVYLFLISKYGTKIIEKGETGGTGQSTLTTTYLKNMNIPIFSNDFLVSITKLVDKSNKKLEDSKKLYKQSEQLLLKELDLLDFEPSKEKIAIKTFSESFGDSGRLDSEYYQPKYDEIVEKIKNYSGGYKSILGALTDDIKSGTTPKTIIKRYIPNSNYFLRAEAFNNDLTLNYHSLYSMNDETFIKYNSIAIKQFDILVSMTGTIGSVAIITEDINAIINQNIVKLSVNNSLINYNVFALYMVTIGKILLTREQTGNVQPYVNVPNFSNLVVPIIDNQIQTKIEEKIKESFKLKEESKQLLEVAKRAVEMAIEDGENEAMKLIEKGL